MATIREIADLANVSIATVSRILNNDTTYKMKPETHDRVWKAVAQTGYKIPIKHNKKSTPKLNSDSIKIGCVLSVTKDKYQDPYFMSILSGIEKYCTEKNYTLAFVKTHYELEDYTTLQETFKDNLDGLVLMESLRLDLFQYIRSKVPICVGIDTRHEEIDNIGYDHMKAINSSVNYLISKGYQKIAYISGSTKENLYNSRRYWGYHMAMTQAGLPIPPHYVQSCDWNEALCMECVKNLIALPDPPTAIVVSSDLMAIAALSALYSLSIPVPTQIAVVGLSDLELAQFSSPPLTTVHIPASQLGYFAIEMIEKRLNGYNLTPYSSYISTHIVERSSG